MATDDSLSRRLESFAASDEAGSRRRAKAAIVARIRNGGSSAQSSAFPRDARSFHRLAPALIAICLALAIGSLFTPAGMAVTSWVGERLGFGEPGGPATLRDLRAFATEGSAAEGRPAFVLVRGRMPSGDHYELITYRTRREPGKLWPANGARCFELDFPEIRALHNAGCGLPPAVDGLRFDGAGGGTTVGGRWYAYASGRVSADVASVEVRFEGRPVPVQLSAVPTDLIERFRIKRPFKFFIAFPPDSRQGGRLIVLARDEAGRVVGRRRGVVMPAAMP